VTDLTDRVQTIARILARYEDFDYDRPDLGGMASEHHLYVMYEDRAREIIAALSALERKS